MEVSKILEKIRHQDQQNNEAYFAIKIGKGLVKSAIWTVSEKQAKLLVFGETEIWDKEDELMAAIDSSLSEITEKFSANQEEIKKLKKAIFGLSADWVEENSLSSKLTIVKNISKELDLEPIGFVLLNEAIIHYLKVKEGVPPSAVLVGVFDEILAVNLVSLGKIVGTASVCRSDNLGADIEEGLFQIGGGESLPARILLYDSEHGLESLGQDLPGYQWSNQLNFLHLPRTEVLAEEVGLQALVLAGGKEVAGADKVGLADGDDLPIQSVAVVEEVAGLTTDEKHEVEKQPSVLQETLSEDAPEVFADGDFGFVRGRDITEKEIIEAEPIVELPVEETPAVTESSPIVSKNIFLKIKSFFPKFSFLKKKTHEFESLSPKRKNKMWVLIIFLVLAIAAGGFVFACWYLPTAEITIFYQPKKLDRSFVVKISPGVSSLVGLPSAALPGEIVEAVISKTKSVKTTGSKVVGQPAKGEIKIYNWTLSVKSLPAATKIKTDNGLEFITDGLVEVPAMSASSPWQRLPGRVSVKVVATKIGPEGNLAAGTEFVIAGFSKIDLVGQNEIAFSEGSRREIQVVSAADQENLLKQLLNESKAEAVANLMEKVKDKKIVDSSISEAVSEKTYDRAVGGEATEVSLNLKVKISGLAYKQSDLQILIDQVLKDSLPSGYRLGIGSEATKFSFQGLKGGKEATFLAEISAISQPDVDLESIKKMVAGQKVSVAKAKVLGLSNVSSVGIVLARRLNFLPPFIPKKIGNMKIYMKALE